MILEKYLFPVLLLLLITNCNTTKATNNQDNSNTQQIGKLRFIGEQIIPSNEKFNNTKVGGLSSIDYANDTYYLISDDKKKPIRFYKMDLSFNASSFSDLKITDVIEIKNDNKGLDPESLRFDKKSEHFIWTSEGSTHKGISPAIFEITSSGESVKTYKTPKILQISTTSKTKGPRRNGSFECLSMSNNFDYFWVGMELPLLQDGDEPQLTKGNYPVRISKINKNTGTLNFQFAYQLEPIPKNSKPSNKFIVNGLPEILEIENNRFLFVERAYASGHKNGGNTVKIFLVDASNASDISKIESLKKANYIPATKTLLFDFESIRSQLTNGIVDNIEGITFGKNLANGNRTLIVVSDNNFNKFSKQLNQIIVLEILQ